MKPLVFLLCICISITGYSQSFKKLNGKIKVGDNTFCLYKEIDIENKNAGSRDSDFKDVVFYTNDTLPVIYMEACALSTFDYTKHSSIIANGSYRMRKRKGTSPYSYELIGDFEANEINPLMLQNLYRVEFSPIQTIIFIKYDNEVLFKFTRDLVGYNVFDNGQFNEEGAEAFIKLWNKKELFHISPTEVNRAMSLTYKTTNYWRNDTSMVKEGVFIDHVTKSIYKGDTLKATYTIKNFPETYQKGIVDTYCPHYLILNHKGNMIVDIYANPHFGFGKFILYPEEIALVFPNVDKSEQKLVSIAIDLLLQANKL